MGFSSFAFLSVAYLALQIVLMVLGVVALVYFIRYLRNQRGYK